MRSWSLQAKVILALVVSFVVIDGVGYAVARYNFDDAETANARNDARGRAESIATIVDLRFANLGNLAAEGAEAVGQEPADKILDRLQRAGLTAGVIVDRDGNVVATSGHARTNDTLEDVLARGAPPALFQSRLYRTDGGWLTVGARSTDLKHAVVGAMPIDYITDSYLADLLIHPTGVNVLTLRTGQILAQSHNAPTGPWTDLKPEDKTLTAADGAAYLVERKELVILDGDLVHAVPESVVDARVDALALRFLLTSSVAFVLATGLTVVIVAVSLRPLGRITEAARRLGRGEERLGLEVGTRDEMGILAEVLNQSAREIGESRRKQQAYAQQLKLASEEFQLAVGELSRSVGEAETAPEIASRLADAAMRVSGARAVAILQGDSPLALRAESLEGDLEPHALEALLSTERGAFRWFRLGSSADDLHLALLTSDGEDLKPAETRKVEILAAQATLAFHRARGTETLREAHDELGRLLHQKQVFLDILSHDLKNPLAVARGRVEMLARRHADLKEKVAPIEQSLDRAATIIDEAVLFAKLERGDALARREVDLWALAEEAAGALRPLARARNIDVAVLAPGPVRWSVSPLLARAVENVLSNAIKWSPEQSVVVVDVAPEADRCRIRVVDHGPGIPPEDRPRLFARFERADRTGVKGTGLGLAIAKRVVDMHGGSIAIEDTPGGGCTFVLTIPLAPSEAETNPGAVTAGIPAPDHGGPQP